MSFDVVAVGHILMDVRFVIDRIPCPDEEAEIKAESRGVGGSAANVAIGVRRLGGSSAVLGKVGFDAFGRHALDELMRENVDVSGVKIGLKPTGFTVIAIDSRGAITMYGFRGAADDLEPGELDVGVIARAKALHIASLRLDTAIAAAEEARRRGALVSWDPGRLLSRVGLRAAGELLSKTDVVLLNEAESRNLTGESDLGRAARLIAGAGPRTVIVKRGEKGVLVLHEGEELSFEAFKPPRVVDTTGAGDAFAAGYLLSLARGKSVREAVLYALATAALKVSRLGSHQVPSSAEVERMVENQSRLNT